MILAMLFACGTDLDRAANPDDTDYPDLADLDAAILDEMALARLPGLSACIVADGQVVWCQGYGLADISAERVVTPQTPFLVASASKAVTGMALARAVEDGLLSLDAPINDTLGFTVTHPKSDAPITARHLAAHVSGIEDNWGVMEPLYTEGDPEISLGAFLKGYLTPSGAYYSKRRNFTGSGPQDRFEYSNVGNALIGHVVESAAGEPFSAYCEARLFAPLGLAHTGWHLSALDTDTIAVPYELRLGSYRPVAHYGFPDYPSGQLRSSAEDMATLLAAVMNDGAVDGARVLSAASAQELTTLQYPSLEADQGLSWYRWKVGGDEVWGHNGGEVGASAEILFWPADDIGAVILTNGEVDDVTFPWIQRRMRAAADTLRAGAS